MPRSVTGQEAARQLKAETVDKLATHFTEERQDH